MRVWTLTLLDAGLDLLVRIATPYLCCQRLSSAPKMELYIEEAFLLGSPHPNNLLLSIRTLDELTPRLVDLWEFDRSARCWRKMDEVSDTELLRLAREAEPAAFRSLIRRHDRYLYRIARSVLLDDEEAEDVVQETFVRAFTHLVDFRGDASLSTWLTRIAFNEALRRRRQRRRIVRLDDLVSAIGCSEKQFDKSTMTAPDLDPERATAQHQIRSVLERAIDDLPDSFRTVFVMRDIEEASTEETASVLGIRPQTVKTRLHRARRRLRDALASKSRQFSKMLFHSNGTDATGWSSDRSIKSACRP
jgi:RNA polymerase sigma-70 factor, ECF subfamily